MMNQGMSREVGCLNSLMSHFFIEKMFYFQFLLLLKYTLLKPFKVYLIKILKDDICML